MIQRIIWNALTQGIAAIAKDPKILDELFIDVWGLDPTEAAGIRLLFAKSPPKVEHGYAHTDSKYPLYTIVLATETESDKYLGDDMGVIDEPDDPDFGADVHGAIWEHNFQILCYAEQPDVTTYIYEVAKNILINALPYFVQLDLFDCNLSGMDLAPDQRYIPDHLFVRALGLRCKREFQTTDRPSRLAKAFKVTGVFVDNGLTPSDTGQVKTLVTVSKP